MAVVKPRKHQDDVPAVQPEAAGALRDVLTLAEKRHQLEAKRQELVQETDRIVLELIDLHQLTQAQVARLLGVSEQRMSVIVREARQRRGRTE